MADRDRFGGSERDYLPSGPAKGIGRSGVSRLGDLPGAQARPRGPWDQDFRWNRGPSTTVPEGFNDPDRFGRMRPTQANNPYAAPIDNNPMRGANIGGGWNMYEGAPERGNRQTRTRKQKLPNDKAGAPGQGGRSTRTRKQADQNEEVEAPKRRGRSTRTRKQESQNETAGAP